MDLPPVGPTAALDGVRAALKVLALEVGVAEGPLGVAVGQGGQVEQESVGANGVEAVEEAGLDDALVPGAQVLGVEPDGKVAQAVEAGEGGAEALPGVVVDGEARQAREGGIGPLRGVVVDLGQQVGGRDAYLDVLDGGGFPAAQEFGGYFVLCEAEGHVFKDGLDAF